MSIIKILQQIRNFPNTVKRIIKKRKFLKYALMDASSSIDSQANIFCSRGGVKIGRNCEICGILTAYPGAKLTIGDYTTIRGSSLVGAALNIKIGNYVIISNNVHIYDNNNHPTDPQKRIELCKSGFHSEKWRWEYSDSAPIVIEDNVWIGERSAILKGVTIGKGSIVASNSVVTKNVPPYSIAAGNPAIVVKQLEH